MISCKIKKSLCKGNIILKKLKEIRNILKITLNYIKNNSISVNNLKGKNLDNFYVNDAPESKTPAKKPRITPEFKKGSPA